VPAGLAAGAGLRGLMGLYHMLSTSDKDENPSAYAPLSINIPPERKKQASPESTSDLWWTMPAMLGTGAAAAYGGWKGVDWLMKKHKEHELQSQVDEAKKEYEAALLGKAGSALGADLDQLYDMLTKEGQEKQAFPSLLGAWLTWALATGAFGAAKGYQWETHKSKADALEKAREQQVARLSSIRPPVFYAVPDAKADIKKLDKENERNMAAAGGGGGGVPDAGFE
jgi:hypothetical protein